MGEAVAGSDEGVSLISSWADADPPSTDAIEEQKWKRAVPLGEFRTRSIRLPVPVSSASTSIAIDLTYL